jgi:GMP synthase (glutamine-hydrolysing)
MKTLYIIKTGTTFPDTRNRLGDFDQWTADALGALDIKPGIVDVAHGEALPEIDTCAGVVITGSHAMVTDNEPWSLRLEKWITHLLKAQTPVFGICYGHQLLARAAGGRVDFHPYGIEIGTVRIDLLPPCSTDPVFRSLSKSFFAHVTHSQTVTNLPETAIRLATNAHEPVHAFRLGECAWGVQFHPEYDAGIMRSYIQEQKHALASAGRDVSQILDSVSETPVAAQVLRNFSRFVTDKMAHH